MKRTNRCRRLFMRWTHDALRGDGDKEHLCMLRREHREPCDGHETSRYLVPDKAQKIVMPFVGTAYVWESDQLPGVFLAYANPPLDLLAQGANGGGADSAMFRLRRTINADRFWDDEDFGIMPST